MCRRYTNITRVTLTRVIFNPSQNGASVDAAYALWYGALTVFQRYSYPDTAQCESFVSYIIIMQIRSIMLITKLITMFPEINLVIC